MASSDLHSLVLPPVPISTPTRHILLPEPLVVVGLAIVAGHVDYIHLHCAGVLQYWVLDTAHE